MCAVVQEVVIVPVVVKKQIEFENYVAFFFIWVGVVLVPAPPCVHTGVVYITVIIVAGSR